MFKLALLAGCVASGAIGYGGDDAGADRGGGVKTEGTTGGAGTRGVTRT